MSNIFKTGIFYKPYLYFNLYFKNKALKKRKTYSQHREDLFIDNYFKHKKNGFYLDIGCYHPIKYSNTALLFVCLDTIVIFPLYNFSFISPLTLCFFRSTIF